MRASLGETEESSEESLASIGSTAMIYEDRTFADTTVEIDGHEFHRCTFLNCTLRYKGTGAFTLGECKFRGERWDFADAARTVISAMRDLYEGGWAPSMESTFDWIRGKPPAQPALALGIEVLTSELERALSGNLFYAAITMALALPDICAALESENGETSGAKYQAWCNAWFLPGYPQLRPIDLWKLRCGILHQGRMGHAHMQYGRVIFSLPTFTQVYHRNVADDALNLEATIFCNDMIESAKRWYAANDTAPHVVANLPHLLQYRPKGLMPYMVDIPIIA
jgi:hypothetical protein